MSGDPRVINHMSSSGSTCSSYVNASVGEELPSVPPLCPPAQRWQMWPPQWKYWELPGHLSGNIWAIWTITFCKWTQIKMYVVAFPRASASRFAVHAAATPQILIMILFTLSVLAGGSSARCAVDLLHRAHRLTAITLADFAREHLKAAGHADPMISGQLKGREIKLSLLKARLPKVFTWHVLTQNAFLFSE